MARATTQDRERMAFALSKAAEVAVLTYGSADEVEQQIINVTSMLSNVLDGVDANVAMLALWKILATHFGLVR